MHVRILGSAAGGGVPQWNCRCANCTAARAGSGDVRPRTQSSVAISADGKAWFLLNASPDLRQQILSFPALGPEGTAQPRGTAIAGCVLTDAELDHTAGLLLVREGGRLTIYATATVRRWLNRWLPVEPILASFCKPAWHDLLLETSTELKLPDGLASGLRVRAIPLDNHAPRFVQDDVWASSGSVIGLEIEDARTSRRLVYAPCLASIPPALDGAAREADCVLVDGTFWDDEEPIRTGIGQRTARAMGHLPVSGPEGTLPWLGDLPARHRGYLHINNTNPMLRESGPEHEQVTDLGVLVGADGDQFEI
jgi:pyrroloquinoline quinone biosynthesis protein B